jgi:hypothetical protein
MFSKYLASYFIEKVGKKSQNFHPHPPPPFTSICALILGLLLPYHRYGKVGRFLSRSRTYL